MALVNSFFVLIGSLGFLLYGMNLMSSGIQKCAGQKLHKALGLMTGNRFISLLTGLIITTIIQSSGATTVMVISFINAGLLTLKQSVGVIFGANIGTTITAWIVSLLGFNLKISSLAVPIFGIGFIFTIITHNITLKSVGEALMGFGLLFLGLDGLSGLFSFSAKDLSFITNLQSMGAVSILCSFFIGIFITALMHSSSAFTAIVITMAFNGVITWEISAGMTLGSNIGSTIDAVLASIKSSTDAKRSAFIHVLFNVIGAALGLLFFIPLLNFVTFLSGSNNIAVRISIFHTVFKVFTTILLIPFTNQIVAFSKKVIKNKENVQDASYNLEFKEVFGRENVAMYEAIVEKEIADMSKLVLVMCEKVKSGLQKRHQKFCDNTIGELEHLEDYCDQMHEKLVYYIIQCQHLPINERQRLNFSIMIQKTNYLESITDDLFSMGMLIKKSIEKKMKIGKEDGKALNQFAQVAFTFLIFISENINKKFNTTMLGTAKESEDKIDLTRDNLKKTVRKRLENNADVKTSLLYLDIVGQIEKIGDATFSIALLLAEKRTEKTEKK